MKTVAVSSRSRRLVELLEEARRENLILRASDGTEFILAEIDDFDREIELTWGNEKLMALLETRARRKNETVSLADAKAELGLS